jgi:isoleucyl-tRNA synthetase
VLCCLFLFETKCFFETNCGLFVQFEGCCVLFVCFYLNSKCVFPGLDQTRGWFYTLMVLSVALRGIAPFKNVIVNGLVLAEDGKKMAKSLKNYPDPQLVMEKYGADSMRLYLINSPVVRAEPLKFREDGVSNVVKDVLKPWYNAYRFCIENCIKFGVDNGGKPFAFDFETGVKATRNVTDIWILSKAQSLIKFVRAEMTEYRLYTVVSILLQFIEQLTNWYIRYNTKRLKVKKHTKNKYYDLNLKSFEITDRNHFFFFLKSFDMTNRYHFFFLEII